MERFPTTLLKITILSVFMEFGAFSVEVPAGALIHDENLNGVDASSRWVVRVTDQRIHLLLSELEADGIGLRLLARSLL